MSKTTQADALLRHTRKLSQAVDALSFDPPISVVYNPLRYARAPHELYLERFGEGPKEAVFLGMNPGPFGMAQTGVPFGDVSLVRDWMGIEAPVEKPRVEHPKRPIAGFDCPRGEVSGARLWGWAKQRFETPERFFDRFFVINYCPLCFMEESGRNFTPDKLPAAQKSALFDVCDRALAAMVDVLSPSWVIGVGAFAEKSAKRALAGREMQIASILHPSPASPRANRGWAQQAEAQLAELGISLPD
jgi:single-strand selective monofunctional uracil DNA glycosylase